jgi:hypothetical protein
MSVCTDCAPRDVGVLQILDNVIEDAQMGLMVGGGRDTVVSGNRFIGCDVAIHVDNRGMTGERPDCVGADMGNLVAVMAVPTWAKYGLSAQHPCIPENNTVTNNCWSDCIHFFDQSAPSGTTMAEQEATMAKWFSSGSGNHMCV